MYAVFYFTFTFIFSLLTIYHITYQRVNKCWQRIPCTCLHIWRMKLILINDKLAAGVKIDFMDVWNLLEGELVRY